MSEGGFPRSVVVYGTGLMGSSIALALRKYLPGIRVYGVDSADVLDRAQGLGAVEAGPAPDTRGPDHPGHTCRHDPEVAR